MTLDSWLTMESLLKNRKKESAALGKKEVQEQKRKGKRKGPGSRKGAKGARTPKKEKWMNTIRPLRKMLKELRENEKIERSAYRKLYRMAKGGAFRSRNHMKLYMKEHGILAE